jgi:hypothetical protein
MPLLTKVSSTKRKKKEGKSVAREKERDKKKDKRKTRLTRAAEKGKDAETQTTCP